MSPFSHIYKPHKIYNLNCTCFDFAFLLDRKPLFDFPFIQSPQTLRAAKFLPPTAILILLLRRWHSQWNPTLSLSCNKSRKRVGRGGREKRNTSAMAYQDSRVAAEGGYVKRKKICQTCAIKKPHYFFR